jgi:hypothetical protein
VEDPSEPAVGPLELLGLAVVERGDLEERVVGLVAEARDQGFRWSDIAAALGVTTEGARMRYHVRGGGSAAAQKSKG